MTVKDLDATVNFYTRVLGMEVATFKVCRPPPMSFDALDRPDMTFAVDWALKRIIHLSFDAQTS